jgi:hypothetical protein
VPLAESLSTGNSSAEEDAQPYDIAAFLPLLLVVKDDVENKTRRVSRAKKSLRKIATSLTKWGQRRFKHPYESEILTIQFPDMIYERADPIMYKPIDSTTVKWVDTIEDFQAMLAQLMKATEIAIDLEHHDYRTYYGLTCLMQISTRDQDWIVDTLVPWRHQMEALNDVFANPNIIKVVFLLFTLLAGCAPNSNSRLRSSTVLLWTSSGYREILASISWATLILAWRARSSIIHLRVSRRCSRGLSSSMQIRSTSWRIGEFGTSGCGLCIAFHF